MEGSKREPKLGAKSDPLGAPVHKLLHRHGISLAERDWGEGGRRNLPDKVAAGKCPQRGAAVSISSGPQSDWGIQDAWTLQRGSGRVPAAPTNTDAGSEWEASRRPLK